MILRIIPPPRTRRHTQDIAELNRTALKDKYRGEYNSWAHAKHRKKAFGHWSDDWNDFRNFLRDMGPKPSARHTLDRIDNNNPAYGPKLCRWANKTEQAVNRSTTRQIISGSETRALPDVAREKGITPNALRKRVDRAQDLQFPSDPRRYRPWPRRGNTEIQKEWEKLYADSGGFKYWSRYDCLITTLKRVINEVEDYLMERSDDDDAEQHKKTIEKRKFAEKAMHHLRRAEREKTIWERAVQDYERKLAEQVFLRSGKTGYMEYDREW